MTRIIKDIRFTSQAQRSLALTCWREHLDGDSLDFSRYVFKALESSTNEAEPDGTISPTIDFEVFQKHSDERFGYSDKEIAEEFESEAHMYLFASEIELLVVEEV